MPRKYRPEKDEILFLPSALSVYGMLRPVEERLLKGGYIGNVLSDYSSQINYYLGQEKQSPLFYDVIQNRLEIEHSGSFVNNYMFKLRKANVRIMKAVVNDNISIDNFTKNFGVKHSKHVTAQVRNNHHQPNHPVNPVL